MNETKHQDSDQNQGHAEAFGPPAPWIVVTQHKSNRVVYFTDDHEYQPPTAGDWYYCSTYLGDLPAEMTLRNCWGWRFNDGAFADAREEPKKPARERLLDNNRKALLQLLHEKINQIRAPYLPSCVGGDGVRAIKLDQACAYMHLESMEDDGFGSGSPSAKGLFDLVQSAAVARGISMKEAAELIAFRAEATLKVMFDTERFREQLTQAIETAKTEAELLEVRVWLLDWIYPELSRQFRARPDDIKPFDRAAPLNDIQRVHESARLKAQLRETINLRRASVDSGYVQNDELRKHKARLAQRLIANNGVKEEGQDFGLLEGYAESRNLSLLDAAELIVRSMVETAELLERTERTKDHMLARIDAIKTLGDVELIDRQLKEMRKRRESDL